MTQLWACRIHGCWWRKCNIRVADTAARSPDDFHALRIFYVFSPHSASRHRERRCRFSRCISPRREINQSKSETRRALNFIRSPIWFMKISTDFFSTLNECTLHSLHATRINLRREPIIQRCRGHWRHKRAAMLRQRDYNPGADCLLNKRKISIFHEFLMRLIVRRKNCNILFIASNLLQMIVSTCVRRRLCRTTYVWKLVINFWPCL